MPTLNGRTISTDARTNIQTAYEVTSKRTDHEAARALNMISVGLLLTDAPTKLDERYRQGQMTIVFKKWDWNRK